MKIHFTIVSIKKHLATVCTVESSLNYRQETNEAKNHLRVGMVGHTHAPNSASFNIFAHIQSLFLSL